MYIDKIIISLVLISMSIFTVRYQVYIGIDILVLYVPFVTATVKEGGVGSQRYKI